jgi:hypothetical protein
VRELFWRLTDPSAPLALALISLLRADAEGWYRDGNGNYLHQGGALMRIQTVKGSFSLYDTVTEANGLALSQASGKRVYAALLYAVADQIQARGMEAALRRLGA